MNDKHNYPPDLIDAPKDTRAIIAAMGHACLFCANSDSHWECHKACGILADVANCPKPESILKYPIFGKLRELFELVEGNAPIDAEGIIELSPDGVTEIKFPEMKTKAWKLLERRPCTMPYCDWNKVVDYGPSILESIIPTVAESIGIRPEKG